MRLFPLVGAVLLWTAPALAAPDYAALLAGAADGPMVAGYRQFQAAAADLDKAVQSFCAAPDATGREAVRAGFHGAMDAWQSNQWISYGPVEAFHRGQRVQFWPDKKNAGDRQMLALIKERKAETLDPLRIPFASVAVQGLPALEMLLWADSQADKLLGAGAEETAFRCKLLGGISANLARIGAELVNEWEKPEGFANTLKSIGVAATPYADSRQAASQLFNALHGELTAIAEVKLSYPLGANAGEARPSRAESWRSKRSARNVELNLRGLRAAFAAGIAPVLAAEGKAAAGERFVKALDDARAALAKLAAPLEDEMTTPEGWARANTVKAKVKAAAAILETDVANVLDLQVGFNALDGD